ncbi:MAG: 4Fe-4S dicluster domain-containing protein [Thermodesulfobacteriota bacterium]|nr:4Fe-4S dicluster domain-containing protein [Thermodesulfobacteriota bacterium]
MVRYVMVIDLKRCIGCQACMVACKVENSLPPEIKWSKVSDSPNGKYPDTNRDFLPMLCMHCDSPPCVDTCPTGASRKRADGIVLVDYNKCIGCRSCILACPYEINCFYDNKVSYFPAGFIPPEKSGYIRHRVGTAQKCTFCAHRVDKGVKNGQKPGVDWDASPACVNACPTGARIFGDLNVANSELRRLIRSRQGYQLQPEAETRPSVYYLGA